MMQQKSFTDRVRRVMKGAHEAAAAAGAGSIAPSHMLLGMIREGRRDAKFEGVAVTVLRSLGVDLSAMEQEIASLGPSESSAREPQSEMPYSASSVEVLQAMMTIANGWLQGGVGTEYIPLAILVVGAEPESGLLVSHGVTKETYSAALAKALGQPEPRK